MEHLKSILISLIFVTALVGCSQKFEKEGVNFDFQRDQVQALLDNRHLSTLCRFSLQPDGVTRLLHVEWEGDRVRQVRVDIRTDDNGFHRVTQNIPSDEIFYELPIAIEQFEISVDEEPVLSRPLVGYQWIDVKVRVSMRIGRTAYCDYIRLPFPYVAVEN